MDDLQPRKKFKLIHPDDLDLVNNEGFNLLQISQEPENNIISEADAIDQSNYTPSAPDTPEWMIALYDSLSNTSDAETSYMEIAGELPNQLSDDS
ncbi:MAG: hypothetical protein SFT91_04870 [Rickettsiaceae bacterium]|nr:hypothetical protein [Rickettsiaceae bacterium]